MLSLSPPSRDEKTKPLRSTLAWRIPWTEGPVGYSPWGHKESDKTELLHWFTVRKYSMSTVMRNT